MNSEGDAMSARHSKPHPPQDQHRTALQHRTARWRLGLGLFLYFAGVVMFFYLRHIEQTGEAASMDGTVALMYWLGGKWLVCGFSGVAGTGFVVAGIVGLTPGRD
jgi:hypothetical protein